ncbi:MAG TPA: transketolase C-terminal domain-containing protein [Elusimicrobiota bacterium]|jgi:transketolase|nr:transketolase C-terminal domain-containing protein [Elusimicrobiota bacterium]
MAKATRQSFGEALLEYGAAHPEVVVLDADLSKSTMTLAFAKKFPERHFEFGIAEANMIGAAAGLAMCGKVPVATSFACFLIGRYETIRVSAAYNQTNVKLVGTHAGIGIGDDGTSQMGLEDVGAMRSLPHVTILQPADDVETRQAVTWMLQHKGAVYIRLTRQKVPDLHGADYKFQVGVCDRVFEPSKRPAKLQATVFASGGTVGEAVAAAKDLESRGFAVRVMNAGTILPFDAEAALRCAAESQRIVTVEDHNVTGGLGSAVCEALAGRGCAVPVVRLGVTDFGESGSGEELYKKYGISAEHIADACLRNL